MKPPFKIFWEEVTPAKAKEWLEKFNKHNRNLRQETALSFSRDMVNDDWSENTQTISFGEDGNLIDGQTRLTGIVKSGRTYRFLICRDVPKRITGRKNDVMDTIDQGNPRSISDVLKLRHGYKADAAMIASSCRTIARVAIADPGTRVRKLTVGTVVKIIGRYKTALQFVSENRPATMGLRAAPISGAVAFAYVTAPLKVKDFYLRLVSGAGLDADSPILILRNYILNTLDTARGTGSERLDLAELVLHALHCVINGKEMPRAPRPGLRGGGDWFRKQQPENIKFIEALFRSLDHPTGGAEVVGPKNFKLTPAAAALIRGKELSDCSGGNT
jgi:hypothetical protein